MNPQYRADPEVMHTDLGNEIILVHGRTGHSYRLNASARCAWLQLPTTPEELAESLVSTFQVDAATAAEDALATLGHMVDCGLAVKVA